ncbi:hypothetical protein TNCV_1968011 [Trichonephila clavipes]|nr:hypothetical protein TNCV_1968011 [Trichonephila clavipes]
MGRVPLPPQIAFLPCTSQSQDKSKARLPIGREFLGHWSIELLCMILGRLDDPADLAIHDICVEESSLVGGISDWGRLTAMEGATEVTLGGLDSEEKTTSADN